MTFSRKSSRLFNRLKNGLDLAHHKNHWLRFMTLTSSPQADASKINDHFQILKKRIERATVRRSGFHGFRFNKYLKILTTEGYGVIHLLYVGRYVPQQWLSKMWQQIHKSPIVDIRIVKPLKGGSRGLANYFISNYLNKNPLKRMSYSWCWLWRGFCNSFQHLRETMQFIHRGGFGSFNISGKLEVQKSRYRFRNCTFHYLQALIKTEPVSSWQKKLDMRYFGSQPFVWVVPK